MKRGQVNEQASDHGGQRCHVTVFEWDAIAGTGQLASAPGLCDHTIATFNNVWLRSLTTSLFFLFRFLLSFWRQEKLTGVYSIKSRRLT